VRILKHAISTLVGGAHEDSLLLDPVATLATICAIFESLPDAENETGCTSRSSFAESTTRRSNLVKGSSFEASAGGKIWARALAVAEDELTTEVDSEKVDEENDEGTFEINPVTREALTNVCKRVKS
jgi:hypothetical protein